MALTINSLGPKALELKVEGVLRKDDYEQFVPLAERRIEENGAINLIVHVAEFGGFTPGALWKDLKFDAKHYSDVQKLAIVGSEGKKWMATVAKPFTAAKVAFYAEDDLMEARTWATTDDPDRITPEADRRRHTLPERTTRSR